MSATETVAEASGTPTPPDTTPRLKQRYVSEIRPRLQSELGLGNVHQVPTISKIVVNMGIGEAINDSKALEGATRDLSRITGQKPAVRRARKSIAGFKLREGMPVGVKATLRGDRMWEFFDRTLTVALPRIRDFRGLKAKLDGRGNYTFGLTEQIVYPEISYDEVDATRGMDVTIVTTAETDEHGRALLEAFGFPFTRSS